MGQPKIWTAGSLPRCLTQLFWPARRFR
jgi:hypothetical protein